jgi:hypothetical protein
MILGYLDPGTGSLILQAILGGLAGAAVLFRAGRQRLFGRKAAVEQPADPESATTSDE